MFCGTPVKSTGLHEKLKSGSVLQFFRWRQQKMFPKKRTDATSFHLQAIVLHCPVIIQYDLRKLCFILPNCITSGL